MIGDKIVVVKYDWWLVCCCKVNGILISDKNVVVNFDKWLRENWLVITLITYQKFPALFRPFLDTLFFPFDFWEREIGIRFYIQDFQNSTKSGVSKSVK